MEEVIIIEDTKELIESVNAVSEKIKSLQLTATDNNSLIELLVKLLDIARTDAYKQGFSDALSLIQSLTDPDQAQAQSNNGGGYYQH